MKEGGDGNLINGTGIVPVRWRRSRIGKGFAVPFGTRRMDFRWIHKGITRERQTRERQSIANYARFNYAVDG